VHIVEAWPNRAETIKSFSMKREFSALIP